MYFLIAGPKNKKINLDFSDKRAYERKTDNNTSLEEYYYYKWSKTEDFARNELLKAEEKLGFKIDLFKLGQEKYLICVNEEPKGYLYENEIEKRRCISTDAFLEEMLCRLPKYSESIVPSCF